MEKEGERGMAAGIGHEMEVALGQMLSVEEREEIGKRRRKREKRGSRKGSVAIEADGVRPFD